MTSRPMTGLAWLSVAGPWLLAAGLFVTVVVTGLGLGSGAPLDPPTLGFLLLTASWGLVQATVGALIALRRPGNRVGRLLQLSGPLVVSVFLGYVLSALRTMTYGPDDRLAAVAGWWASSTIFIAIYLAFPLLGILYPDGRLPSLRWRLPVATTMLGVAAAASFHVVAAGPPDPGLPDNPFGFLVVSREARDAVSFVGTLGLLSGMILAVLTIAVRWRRGDTTQRSQLKWLFAVLAVAGILFPVSFGTSSNDEPPGILAILSVASALLIPVAVGVAVLRYRLYEIDRIISRTIGWALVTGLLVGVFGAVVIALQGLLQGFTQGQTLAVAASTLVAFALFQPLRRRVQAAVDHRFDRARFDAQQTSEGFAERVRNEVDLLTLRLTLVRTTDQAVRPVASGVWLRSPAEDGR